MSRKQIKSQESNQKRICASPLFKGFSANEVPPKKRGHLVCSPRWYAYFFTPKMRARMGDKNRGERTMTIFIIFSAAFCGSLLM